MISVNDHKGVAGLFIVSCLNKKIMNVTELTDGLIEDLDFANKAATIIPTPHNVVNAVSNSAKKGEVMKFYLEEFTASTSLYISIPAIHQTPDDIFKYWRCYY